MNASTVIQLLILLDQITAQVVKLIESVKDIDGADEAELQALLSAQRAKNDSLYESVLDRLKSGF